ncbi:uncharacterized protein LOC143459822 [Clavelina lepadiformis]|uniref:uncharacterized protein LOC143459822 n=1 Tax=Clavelina lepadiformis TaxID=159417 RepID=UPI0040410EE7
MYTKNTKSSAKRLKSLTPAQHTSEALYGKLGLSLPPIAGSPHNDKQKFKDRLSNEFTSRNRNNSPKLRPTLIFGRSFSAYVRKPVYFCHPIVITKTKVQDSDVTVPKETELTGIGKNNDATSNSECGYDDERFSSDNQRQHNTIPASDRKARKDCVAEKFVGFCEREGYNIGNEVYKKTSAAFQKNKKYLRISKPPCLVVLEEENYSATRKAIEKASNIQQNNLLTSSKKKTSCTKQIIKGAAQLSAVKGQNAAAKAITFILKDSQKTKITLPPIDRNFTDLHNFTGAWQPTESIVISKRV